MLEYNRFIREKMTLLKRCALLLLPFVFKPFKNMKLPLFIFCYVYAALTAVSRLIMGRHFISDTAAAILIMTIVFMVLAPKFEKLYKRELLKE